MQSSRTGGRQRWPTGHLGWTFAGPAEFEGRTASYLAEGLARGERLVLVADDPSPELWPRPLLAQGVLVVSSTAEVYGPDRIVDPVGQRLTFQEVLGEARELGYNGVRVAADNTSLLAGDARLAAWLEWEAVADDLMRSEPITGLCAFDRTKTDARALAAAMGCHPVTVGSGEP